MLKPKGTAKLEAVKMSAEANGEIGKKYLKVSLPQTGFPFHNWTDEPSIDCHLDQTDYKLANGDVVNKVTRHDNSEPELIGVNVKLQQYFTHFGIGKYFITRGKKVKAENSGNMYYDYVVEFEKD